MVFRVDAAADDFLGGGKKEGDDVVGFEGSSVVGLGSSAGSLEGRSCVFFASSSTSSPLTVVKVSLCAGSLSSVLVSSFAAGKLSNDPLKSSASSSSS